MSQLSARRRTLTEKGHTLYEENVQRYTSELSEIEEDLNKSITKVANIDSYDLSNLKQFVTDLKYRYDSICEEFTSYLQRTRTEASEKELSSLSSYKENFLSKYSDCSHNLDVRIQLVASSVGQGVESHPKVESGESLHLHSPKMPIKAESLYSRKSKSEVGSAHSRRSKHNSVNSSLDSETRALRIKAKTARAKLDVAVQEAEIMKKRAELDARLHVLTHQKELDETEAELEVLGEESEYSDQSDEHSSVSSIKRERTNQFVRDQCPQRTPGMPPIDVLLDKVSKPLNPEASAFNPHNVSPNNNTLNSFSHLTKHMLKKELSLNRLSSFDDKVEMYALWKSRFCDVVKELELTSNEELDLLVKYLGLESKKQALSIRASNASNPQRALERVWERLDERFASPELVEASVKKRLADFPKINNKEPQKLYELSDLVSEIESLKDSEQYHKLFSYFDASSGVTPIVSKLPYALQEKWTNRAMDYKQLHRVSYPPFTFFSKFIRDMAKLKNDPSFCYLTQPEIKQENTTSTRVNKQFPGKNAGKVSVNKTETNTVNPKAPQKDKHCMYHDVATHSLNFCKRFRSLSLSDRQKFLSEKKACFKCCGSGHVANSCKKSISCGICKKSDHVAAMHVNTADQSMSATPAPEKHGGEPGPSNPQPEADTVNSSCTEIDTLHSSRLKVETIGLPCSIPSIVESTCTEICHNPSASKSCAKTVLVRLFHREHPHRDILAYVILDDQSNRSLANSKFFKMFQENGPETPYSLRSCAGLVTVTGRRATGYSVQSLDGSQTIHIPLLIECNEIPNNREEISTPEVANFYPHLSDISDYIPPLDPNAEILLLIGRDVPSAHHVHDQRIGPLNGPFAQKTSLGWAIVGEVCLNGAHSPDTISVSKTSVLHNGRPSFMEPCENYFLAKPDLSHDFIFERCVGDEKCGLSVEDKTFLKLMDKGFHKNENGNWVAPLPFRNGRPRLENNKDYVRRRMMSLVNGLEKNPEKKSHMVEFMEKIFERGHAEVAPPTSPNEECWYLPLFGVYNLKKPGKVRVVFDSSAKYKGTSLNDVLLTGPDLTNSLLGVLIRFRKEAVAVTADVEQMFHNFVVQDDHRNYLRFFWYKDNDPDQDLIEYRMTVHVFGNTPSPAVSTYGLRKSVESADQDVQHFVKQNFYVDDGLVSVPDEPSAVDLMHRTQVALHTGGNLRLHKIAANSKVVLDSFSPEDLAKGLENLDLISDSASLQSSLGLVWDINSDTFTYKVSQTEKLFTRRGVLSTINSLYDPIGFIAPVIIQGKIILREITSLGYKWDDPLPDDFLKRWESWKNSLAELENLKIPRMYSDISLSKATRIEMHIFCDASNEAVAAVSYLRVFNHNQTSQVRLILGKAKIAPQHGHTIPRLELCAAVMAVEIYEILLDHLDVTLDLVQFYSDSKVVLGYIKNEKRRFYVYVENRVDRIRRLSHPQQWTHVPSHANPADLATRGVPSADMHDSPWLYGPPFFPIDIDPPADDIFSLDLDNDVEVRPLADVMKTNVGGNIRSSIIDRLEKFSSWKRLVKAVAHLRHVAMCFASNSEACKGWHLCTEYKSVGFLKDTELYILKELQYECFQEEVTALQKKLGISASSSIYSLSPYLDEAGILRVGGRLSKMSNRHNDLWVHPMIIPKNHFISRLLVRHFHQLTHHQGRHITEGAVRNAGFWIVGSKKLVSGLISKCVVCRRTRGKTAYQKMGDLPIDRLTPNPPFTYVGLDVFGPWEVMTRRTRGGSAASKKWAVMFTCLVSRAIHIEVIEELSASSFINSLRRFIALRGPVQQIRSDRGTNFIGAVRELGLNAIFDEGGTVQRFLSDQGCTWVFNPPHASHMGGSWERMIGIARRILDNMFLSHPHKFLTHEVLVTFMAEVCAIINGRPIVPVSTDPDDPFVLTPLVLLTQKLPGKDYSFPDMDVREAYKSNWKYVQILAEEFWKKWHREYMHSLQSRKKWVQDIPNLKEGDIVLIKDLTVHRNGWPLGIVVKTFPGNDGLVRKVEVRIAREGKSSLCIRPVTELVHLC